VNGISGSGTAGSQGHLRKRKEANRKQPSTAGARGETTAALGLPQTKLSTSQLLLEIEIGDASFRVDELEGVSWEEKKFLSKGSRLARRAR